MSLAPLLMAHIVGTSSPSLPFGKNGSSARARTVPMGNSTGSRLSSSAVAEQCSSLNNSAMQLAERVSFSSSSRRSFQLGVRVMSTSPEHGGVKPSSAENQAREEQQRLPRSSEGSTSSSPPCSSVERVANATPLTQTFGFATAPVVQNTNSNPAPHSHSNTISSNNVVELPGLLSRAFNSKDSSKDLPAPVSSANSSSNSVLRRPGSGEEDVSLKHDTNSRVRGLCVSCAVSAHDY